MNQTRHKIRVQISDSRFDEPHDGGLITVEGEPYAMSEDRALEIVLASEHLDFEAPGSSVRWKGMLIPRENFVSFQATVESATKLD